MPAAGAFLSFVIFSVRAPYILYIFTTPTSVARGSPFCSPRKEVSVSQKRWTGTGLESLLKKPVSNFNVPNSAPPSLPYHPPQNLAAQKLKTNGHPHFVFGAVSNLHHFTGGRGMGAHHFAQPIFPYWFTNRQGIFINSLSDVLYGQLKIESVE